MKKGLILGAVGAADQVLGVGWRPEKASVQYAGKAALAFLHPPQASLSFLVPCSCVGYGASVAQPQHLVHPGAPVANSASPAHLLLLRPPLAAFAVAASAAAVSAVVAFAG